MQALLGRQFTRHPALVQTFDLGVRPLEPPSAAPPPPGTLVRHALWIVTALCNRGSLRAWAWGGGVGRALWRARARRSCR